TYSLAVLARANAIPFYVVGPLSSFDPAAADGAAIEIEQRPADEVAWVAGSRLAPEGTEVWNPAFDVTPADLVTAFITAPGILPPPFGPSIPPPAPPAPPLPPPPRPPPPAVRGLDRRRPGQPMMVWARSQPAATSAGGRPSATSRLSLVNSTVVSRMLTALTRLTSGG